MRISTLLLVPLLVSTASLTACGKSDDGTDALADVVYEGGTESTALSAMLAATPKDDPANAAIFTWPSNGDVVKPDPPPELCRELGGMAKNEAAPVHFDRGFIQTAPAPVEKVASSPEDVGSPGNLGLAESLFGGALLGPSSAYAQAVPLSGVGYFVVFSTSKNPKLLRVFTTGHDYTPSPAALMKLKAAGETIQAVVTAAMFDKDAVAKSGGPYKGVPVTFTIAQ